LALNAIDKRASNTTTARPSRPIQRRLKTKPLFDFDENDPEYVPAVEEEDFDDDPELSFALQESLDQTNAARSMQMTPSPRGRALSITNVHSSPSTSTSTHHLTPRRSSSLRRVDRDSDEEEMYGSRLETALAIANAGPRRPLHISPHSSPFGKPALLGPASHTTSPLSFPVKHLVKDDSDDDMEEVIPVAPANTSKVQSNPAKTPSVSPVIARDRPMTIVPTAQKSDEMEGTNPFQPTTQISSPGSPSLKPQVFPSKSLPSTSLQDDIPAPWHRREASSPIVPLSYDYDLPSNPIHSLPQRLVASTERVADEPESGDEEEAFSDWSRSPSPVVGLSNDTDTTHLPSASHETWDAAQEMDLHAEEGEFARFMSQVKGRDLDDVRAEIDEEIKSLNQQKKAAMRDSDDITQQMISQIMVRLITRKITIKKLI
jgi:DNA excision repair protein ERCC-5